MNRPILITGAAGYIGSHALRVFRTHGRSVIALDNLSTGNRWAIPTDVPFHVGDIADEKLLREIYSKSPFDSVVHFAAKTSVEESVREPELYRIENTEKTVRLAEVCGSLGVRNFIFSSTCAVYGSAAGARVSETTPTRPDSPYGSTKLAAEGALLGIAKASRMSLSILRYFNVAGANAAGDLGAANPKVHSLVTLCAEAAAGKRKELKILGTDYPTPDGTGVRDYIHVDDLAQAHFDVLVRLEKGGSTEIFNCGYGKPYSVREVIAAMESASGKKIKVIIGARREGDISAIFADSDKLRKMTGWQPRLDDLLEICRSAYAWELKRP